MSSGPASAPVDLARSRRVPPWVLTLLAACGAGYLYLFADAISRADAELLTALTVAPVLLALTLPFALRIARTDGDATLVSIIVVAAALKILMAYVRLRIAADLYTNQVDARQYDEAGRLLAPQFRTLDFATNLELVGTGFVKFMTGIVYAIVGTSTVAGYMVYSWIGFLGLLLVARAFRRGLPQGLARRYLLLVLFLPSLVYWPSAIGKEAPMMLCIGLCAYGAASVFTRHARGALALPVGLAGMLLIRPHMTIIVFAALVFAGLLHKSPARTYAAPLMRMLGIAVLVLMGVFLASQASSFLDSKLEGGSLTEQLDETASRTTEAGSSFDPFPVRTPLDIPPAFVTVLFRPFPFEASSGQGLLTALEGVVLVVALFVCRQRLRSLPRLVRTNPYVAYSMGYLLAFVIAFSNFSNFGILARQRVQGLPFLLVLFALPRFRELVSAPADEAEDARHLTVVPAASPPTASPNGGTRRRRRPATVPGSDPATVSAGAPVTRPRTPVSSGPSFAPPTRTT